MFPPKKFTKSLGNENKIERNKAWKKIKKIIKHHKNEKKIQENEKKQFMKQQLIKSNI